MRKKYIFYISSISIFIFLSCLLIAIKISEKISAEARFAKTPEFSFKTLTNKLFTNKNIDNRKSRLILNHFSPNCDHCQYMAVELVKDSLKLKDFQVLMITSADSLSASKFSSYYKVSLLSNVVILRDINHQFQKIFGIGVVPSFFIYEHNKLVKKIIGETKIENLIN